MATLSLAGLLGLFLAISALASHWPNNSDILHLTGSNFEIDGGDDGANLEVDRTDPATPPSLDWANVTEDRKADEDSGSADDSFGNGTKEDTAVPSVVDGGIPPNKSDLLNFGVYLEENADGRFMHLFWHRVQEPSGTTNMDFEFNKSETISSNGVTPVRTAGDMLIQYDLAQGGTTPELFVSRWVASGPKSQCEAANSTPCWGTRTDLTAAGDATGSINNVAIPSTESDGLGDVSARTFGEASLDFDALAGGGCTPFGSAYLKSRSSDSFTSALKDFIAPQDLDLSNCGQIIIKKRTSPRGVNQAFPFTSDISGSELTCTGDSTPADFTLNDSGNSSSDSAGNTENCTNVPEGTYTVTEGANPTGFVFNNFNCTSSTGSSATPSSSTSQKNVTISLAGGGVVTCVYTNDQVQTTTTTRQFVFPQDKARITATGGGNLTGTLTFQLFDSFADCNGTPVQDVKFEQSYTLTNVAPPAERTTTNYPGNGAGPGGADLTPYRITDGQTHFWKVTYDSTNAQTDSVSACTETTAVTFAGNDTANISIP